MKNLNNRICLLADCLFVNMALFIALMIRFDANIPESSLGIIPINSIITTTVSLLIYNIFGIYSMLWDYASIEELLKIFWSTIASTIVQLLLVAYFNASFPISVYIIAWMITFYFVGGVRFIGRITKIIKIGKRKKTHKKRIMIIGAGEAASILIKEMKKNKRSNFEPVVAIDDDPKKHNTQINGVPVIGGRDKIIKTATDMSVEEIVLAIPSITRKETLEIIDICQNTGCKLKVLPSVYSLVNGEVSIKEIRDVTVEDLLQRDEISLSIEEISGYLKGETILVTGGGGSIGSELCRQIASYKPKTLLVFDIYENNAYELQNELVQRYKDNLDIKVIIGSIRDKKRLDYVFSRYKPGIVFHAAAHKHVPLMEFNPQEAVKNNVFGTLNLAECAHRYNCKKFVLISTDKAVNPTSIMGATKRIAELIIQYMNSISETKFSAVRFGNVLDSNGSVIPLFKKQIEQGGPITITHPEVTRYFMTIPEAVSLVIQSGAMMEGGEIFVLDMGKPVKILDLARSLISLSGLKPGVDIDIKYIGLRPGEKLYEELLISEDGVGITKNDKIFIEKSKLIDIDKYMQKIKEFEFDNLDNPEKVINFIKELVPTYQKNL
ncbi:MAG TPA: nucleoside-diphosphate sugar epimerase/dehydratase [Acetivibrio sp.]|uniref:polysaccharide biosynthesis protein n=1 Tax=Acetivibrio sp. TaxID=1872092 RepID=UPI002CE733AB|nr:nucleoside-diphosphate sugar epimerase/dehydratase [Acetivibrio sp.]HOM02473.1 nucleoside-diphosphate sugar epimerase/dehydratase [Acetivibrio sp.]